MVEHLYELFHVGTQGVEKMLEILNTTIQSPKLVEVNRTVTKNCVHCQANKPRNAGAKGRSQYMPVPK